MKRVATLGPKGTFTEIATKKYVETREKDSEIVFYPTINRIINAIGEECELGIIPIENTLDGYVQRLLDLLLHTDLNIIHELIIPIQFSFVANAEILENVEKIYVQFKTQGQCCKFLEQFINVKIITTESNGESLEKVREGIKGEAAIICQYMYDNCKNFQFGIENVTDSKENETRFIVLTKDLKEQLEKKHYKTSLVITDAADEPGILSKILNAFAEKNINLHSIISRPTKKGLGKYYFFIDVEGNYNEDEALKQAVDKIKKKNVVKILGTYSSL